MKWQQGPKIHNPKAWQQDCTKNYKIWCCYSTQFQWPNFSFVRNPISCFRCYQLMNYLRSSPGDIIYSHFPWIKYDLHLKMLFNVTQLCAWTLQSNQPCAIHYNITCTFYISLGLYGFFHCYLILMWPIFGDKGSKQCYFMMPWLYISLAFKFQENVMTPIWKGNLNTALWAIGLL